MSRRFLAVTTLMLAMIALSQLSIAQVIVNGTVTYPPVSGNTVLLGNGPTTPVMTYAAPGPTAGISNAGRAGISNTNPLPSTLAVSNDTVVYYTQPGVQPMITLPGAVEGIPPVAVMPAATETAPAQGAAEGAPPEASTPEASSGRAPDDFGPSSFGGASSGVNAAATGTNTVSLGQIAAQYKAANTSFSGRTLSNQDVQQMLNSKAGVTVAKNMPPLGPSAMPSGITQGGVASPNQPQSAPAQPSALTAQSNNPANPQTTTPPPADTTQAQPAGNTATAGAETTPQINPTQQSNDAQGKSKLPSTATFLPLLGLLGLASGGIGLLVRKFRR